MKLFRTENKMVTLENFRKATLHSHTDKHTSKGVAYTTDIYEIWIDYTDGHAERFECGENAEGKAKAKEIFEEIFKILSEKA